MKFTLAGFIIVLLLSWFLVKPMVGPGYFPMHYDTQVARVVVMGKALREGQFPVRWVSDLGYGYGYPLYNFYAPLPYYFGGTLYAFGIDSVVATKTMFTLGVLLAVVFFYLFADYVFGTIGAIVGTLFFSYAPYHAVQVYVRGAVGEYWSIAFAPLILWGFSLIAKKKSSIGIVVGGVGLSCVIVSHTILGFLTTGIVIGGIILYSIVAAIRRTFDADLVKNFILTVLLGLGLSAFFWLPAFVEMGSTSVSSMISHASTNFFDHFVCPLQLWDSPWGYAGSAPGCIDGMSFKLGKLQLIVTVAGAIMWIVSLKNKKNSIITAVAAIGVFLFILSVAGMIDISKQIWLFVPFVSFIQYPWRLLTFAMFAMGISASFLIAMIPEKIYRIPLAIFVVGVCLFMNAKLFVPQYLYARDSRAFETMDELRFRISKISDEYLPQGIKKPINVSEIVSTPITGSQDLTLSGVVDLDTYYKAVLESKIDQQILFQKAAFPGWIYRMNGALIHPAIVHGVPRVILSKGKSTFEASLTNTPVRIVGNALSVISLVLAGGILLYGKKTKT